MILYSSIYCSLDELNSLLWTTSISIGPVAYGRVTFIDDNSGRTISDEDIYDILNNFVSSYFTYSASISRITCDGQGQVEIMLKAKKI